MKSISEVWRDGKLVERKEYDDGIPTIEELDARVEKLESPTPQLPSSEPKR